MAVTVQLNSAAHQYGFDSLAFEAGTEDEFAFDIGDLVSVTTSLGGASPTLGVAFTAYGLTSNGFTVRETLTFTSATSGVLSAVEFLRTSTGEVLLLGTGSAAFNEATLESDLSGANLFRGADTITGNAYNNVFQGGLGNDRIDGAAGTDVAVFRGLASQYSVTRNGTTMTVSGPDGVDTLLNMERLQFDGSAVAYDISGNAGQSYRLYQAAFNRTPDIGGLSYWIKSADGGLGATTMAQYFIDSAEFKSTYGANLDNQQYVAQLYLNALHRTLDQAGSDYWVGHLNAGHISRAEALVFFSESPENQAQVLGAITNGIAYTA